MKVRFYAACGVLREVTPEEYERYGLSGKGEDHPNHRSYLAMWRVAFDDPYDNLPWVIPMDFGRRKDAEIAAEAMNKLGLEFDDVMATPNPDLYRMLCEALPW